MVEYLLGGALFCGFAALLTAFICYRKVFAVTNKEAFDPLEMPRGKQYAPYIEEMRKWTKIAMEIPFEEVYITSFDGAKLYGRYYETKKGAPTQILFHGYQSSAFRDMSGGLPLALKSGCNALLVDQRAHGKSGGKCLSFGVLERYDCLAWANYAAKTYGGKIILTGISMGAATVLMASNLDLPKDVVGIISDCGYSSPKGIICDVMEKVHYPVNLVYPFVRLGGRLFGGFDIESSSAEKALKNAKVPVLFLHGAEDRFVPCKMSTENYNACSSQKEIHIFETAAHGLCYTMEPKRYEKAVMDFINKVTE